MAAEVGLTLQQTFEKKEATVEDVLLVLKTLWERGRDIPADPRRRTAFHSIILIAALAGCRPDVMTIIKYKDVELALIRGSAGPVLVAKVTLTQNKRKEGRIRQAQDDM